MFEANAVLAQLNVRLQGLSEDSRRVAPGCAFLAYPGDADDGRRHISSALRAGAAAVLWEAEDFCWRSDWATVPNQPVHDLREKSGALADAVYGAPSAELPVAAVTGTNGKTSVSHLTALLLTAAGGSPYLIGTLGGGRLGALRPLANTTPAAPQIHALLRDFADEGASAVVLEASSHGISRGRLNGVRLAAAVFTNAGHDHLDEHGDVQSYWQSKAALFETETLQTAILNADDEFCATLATTLRRRGSLTVRTYGTAADADCRLLAMTPTAGGGVSLRVAMDGAERGYDSPLPGRHNADNFLAAMLLAECLGADAAAFAEAAARLTLPPGRLQKVHAAPAVYVDFAHTPDALRATLTAARQLTTGRLLAVVGCGGERDTLKRRAIGETAAALADTVIITDDNPRRETAAAIRAAVQEGAPQALNIGGRRAAIAEALQLATAEDAVLILGKGHETVQEIDGRREPFSDEQTVRAVLAEAAG